MLPQTSIPLKNRGLLHFRLSCLDGLAASLRLVRSKSVTFVIPLEKLGPWHGECRQKGCRNSCDCELEGGDWVQHIDPSVRRFFSVIDGTVVFLR